MKMKKEIKNPDMKSKKRGKNKKEDLNKIAGGIVNNNIDKGKNKLIEGGKKTIGNIGGSLIKKGANKDFVNVASKQLIKHGTKFVNESAGKVKNYIHTEGRQALKGAANYVMDKGKELGNKAKSKWGEFTNGLKRKR